jgi:outer membrane autotransporter protein
MKFDVKKLLLAGTAIVAVSAFGGAANAATLTLTGASTWGTTAPVNAPTAGDDVVMTTFNLLINNTLNTAAGAITATTGDLTITDSAAANIAQTIGSFVSSSTGDFTILGNDANTANIAATITGDLTTGGALSVTQVETSSADTMALSVGDDLTVTGITTLTAGAFAGATSAITVTDDAAFTGAVTVTGGAGVGSTATLNIGGDATFTAGLNLVTDDKSIFTVSGTTANTITGVISGAGDINVTNTNATGVTFVGDSTFTGELVVNNNGNNQAVTFTGDFAGNIGLGNNVGADTVTANFNGTTLAISGGITGGAAETVNVNFLGGSTITLSGAASSGIDTAAISGSTTVTTNQNFGATNITVASGSTLATTANTITGAVANSGTLVFGGGNITGAITGTGALDVNAGGTFTGAVTQGSADIAAFTLTQGSASGWDVDTTNFSGAGTLALLGGAQTITSNFTNTTDGQGTITITDVTGTTTVVGDLGASTSHSLAALTLANGANAINFATSGDLFVDAVSVGTSDTLTFTGSSQTVSGTVNGTGGANRGTLVLGNGTTQTPTVTFDGIIGAVNTLAGLTVNDNSTAIFNQNATFAGALSADVGTIEVENGKTLTAATQTDADVTTWNINVNKVGGGAQTNGTVIFTGDGVNLAVDTVNFQVQAGSAPLTTGASVLSNVFQGNAVSIVAGATVTDNSFFYDFALVGAVDNNVDVTISAATTVADAVTTGNNETVANVLLTELAASTDADINFVQGNLAAAETQEEFNEILESVLPTVDGGAMVAVLDVANTSLNLTGERLAALRTGDTPTGMAAGDMADGVRWWVQGFGATSTQDQRDGIDGYDSDTWGAAVGVDTENINDRATVGVAFSYGSTDVSSDNANHTDTEVSSYQLALYGDYDLDDATYVSGMTSYGWNDVDQTRHDVGGAGGADANSDYDADQFTVRAEVGRDLAYGSAILTPNAMAHWTHYSPDGYTETGAGGLNQTVDSDSLNIFELGVGADAGWDFQNADGSHTKPSLHLGYRYDLIGDEVEATTTFAGGGAAFGTQGPDPARSTFVAGAAVDFYSTANWELSVNYDYTFKEDFDAHSGFLRAGYNF